MVNFKIHPAIVWDSLSSERSLHRDRTRSYALLVSQAPPIGEQLQDTQIPTAWRPTELLCAFTLQVNRHNDTPGPVSKWGTIN